VDPRYKYEIGGMAAITAGVLLGVALVWPGSGVVTQGLVEGLRAGVGQAAGVFPLLLFFLGGVLLVKQERLRPTATALGLALVFLTLLGFLGLRAPEGMEYQSPQSHGGWVGAVLVHFLRRWFGPVGSGILLTATALTALLVTSDATAPELLGRAGVALRNAWQRLVRRGQRPTQRKADQKPRSGKPPQKPAPPASAPLPHNLPDDGAATQLALPGTDPNPYPFPTLSLIEPDNPQRAADREAEIAANSVRLEEALASFNVQAKVVATERGPAITRYEVVPAPGIRVSKVANLADDLALALAALDVRVEAPVPGKGVIGIEVPNQEMDFVYLVDILRSPAFQNAESKLTFALGKDIAGHPMVGDLARMPHLLIGGATNSGKSVCLNALIVSILYRAAPHEVRFLMIDPKRVELTLYAGIPHLDRPVVTNAKDAADLLRGAVLEMEARYDRFAALGVRHITTYNKRVPPEEQMAYIVIIIDELADLMMQASAEFETLICRIAQLARATGIHLVIATQRPSVNVITGLIKANISSRIAFAVASQVDSRTILDTVGAERLIGRGDMLYWPIDASKPTRIQGAYIDEDQVRKLADHLHQVKRQMRFDYRPIVVPIEVEVGAGVPASPLSGAAPTPEGEPDDELYPQAVALVQAEGQASASRLQRKFGIGYNRAGRLIDLLEQRGVIGPADGSRPRQVLIPAEPEEDLSQTDEEGDGS
jgi:S-DNA-T family DNA segregation ATPase FtsK/SpoIIIE